MAGPTEIAPGVFLLRWGVANVYIVRSGDSGAVVDTGFPGRQDEIRAAAARLLGGPPRALLLTHGHFDHSGSAEALSELWDLPIHVHHLEAPYVRGTQRYPKPTMPDPPPRGFMRIFQPRAFPRWIERHLEADVVARETLGERVRGFDGPNPPGLPDWQVIETPGHSPGHVAFFRPTDRVLLSGDALITVDADSWRGLWSMTPVFARPPSPATVDWPEALRSLQRMAALNPNTVGAGHGIPISGPDTAARLGAFVADLIAGRRVAEAAS